jgi:hypothetical protein
MKYLFVALLLTLTHVQAQRFLREGFSSGMENDMRGEMKLDENEALAGMSREMFLMQDLAWELEPPQLENIDGKLKKHIQRYLSSPIQLKLLKKRGKFGLRAIGKTGDGLKLRAFWRQGTSPQVKTSDFLSASYDDAVRSRLPMVEFEVVLPPMQKGKALPSVVYQVAVEPGTMNPKAMIPRGSGKIRVYPLGHEKGNLIDAGACNVGMTMKAGLVDPSWAKGRKYFWQGRSTGLI